jgi:hypothetical protein
MTQNKKFGGAWRLAASRRGRRIGLAEYLVRAASGGMAILSATFAAHMIADGDRRPEFAGVEYLSIFKRTAMIASGAGGARSVAETVAVDQSPVGSIAKTESGGVASAASHYHVRQASADSALLVTLDRTLRVRRGDRIVDLGLIASIERRSGKWVVVTQSGEIIGE